MRKLISCEEKEGVIDLTNIDEEDVLIYLNGTDAIHINPSEDLKIITILSKDCPVKIYNNITGDFLCNVKVGMLINFKKSIEYYSSSGVYTDFRNGYIRLAYDGSEGRSYANYAIDFNNKYSPRSGSNMHNFHMYSEILCKEAKSGNITGYYAHLDADPTSCTGEKEVESISLFKGLGTYSASATLNQFNGMNCYIFPQGESGGHIKRIYGGIFGVDFYKKSDVLVDYIVGVSSKISSSENYAPKRGINYAICFHGYVDNKSAKKIDSAYGIILSKGKDANIGTYYGLYIKDELRPKDFSIYANTCAPSYFKGLLKVDGICIACYAEVLGDGDVGDPIIVVDGKLHFKSGSKKEKCCTPVTGIAVNPSFVINNRDMIKRGGGRIVPIVLRGIVIIKKGRDVGKGWVYLGEYNSEMEAWLKL